MPPRGSDAQIHDVRHPTREFAVGTGIKRPGKRLLTVGTDCSIGKMFTALALEKEMRARGIKADFRATGQTGIFIAGDGVSIDAVVSDFVSGAVEWLCPANDPDHWDLIEGQGSLFHASYAGVTLGLIHGAQPDALVMCHEPTRKHMRGLPHYKLPDLKLCIERNVEAAQLTNPAVRCVGISVNTAGLDPAAARDYLRRTEDEHGIPCVDPVRTGVGAIVDRLVADQLSRLTRHGAAPAASYRHAPSLAARPTLRDLARQQDQRRGRYRRGFRRRVSRARRMRAVSALWRERRQRRRARSKR